MRAQHGLLVAGLDVAKHKEEEQLAIGVKFRPVDRDPPALRGMMISSGSPCLRLVRGESTAVEECWSSGCRSEAIVGF